MTERVVEANGVELCIETFGDPADLARDAIGILDVLGVERAHLVGRSTNLASALTNHFVMDFDGPESGGYGDIVAPTLVVHGALDPVFPLPHGEALAKAIPGASLSVLADTGHDLPRQRYDEFVTALVRHTGTTVR